MKTMNSPCHIPGRSLFRFCFAVRAGLRASGGILLFTTLLGLAASVPAAETDAASPPSDLMKLSPEELMKVEPKVYGASKREEDITKAPASVTVIDADEIKKYGYRTLADVLRSVRSLYVTYDRNYAFLG